MRVAAAAVAWAAALEPHGVEKPGVATSPLAVSFAKINMHEQGEADSTYGQDYGQDYGLEYGQEYGQESGGEAMRSEEALKTQMTAWTMSSAEAQTKVQLEREGLEAEAYLERNQLDQRFLMYKLDSQPRTQVIMLTHLADEYSKRQVELLYQTFGEGRGVGLADLQAKDGATGYIPRDSLAYQRWTDNDDEVLTGLNEMVPRGGLLLGRALQMFDANPEFDHAWIIENDVYFGDDSAQSLAELVQRYESSDSDLIYAHSQGVGFSFAGQQFGDRWYFWDRCEGKFPGMMYAAFMPVMRVSRRMVREIGAYISEHKKAMFMECFIPTLANKKGLKAEGLDDTFGKYIRFRPKWERAAALKAVANGAKLVHPAKFGH